MSIITQLTSVRAPIAAICIEHLIEYDDQVIEAGIRVCDHPTSLSDEEVERMKSRTQKIADKIKRVYNLE